jgi:pimeloyl-ACP methyl ester carboxylesterase
VRAQDSYLPSFQTRARHPTSCRQAELGGPHERREYPRHHNDDRAPLLLIAGGEDHLFPPSVNESNVKHYRNSKAITEFEEFPGRALHVRAGRLGGGRRLRP